MAAEGQQLNRATQPWRQRRGRTGITARASYLGICTKPSPTSSANQFLSSTVHCAVPHSCRPEASYLVTAAVAEGPPGAAVASPEKRGRREEPFSKAAVDPLPGAAASCLRPVSCAHFKQQGNCFNDNFKPSAPCFEGFTRLYLLKHHSRPPSQATPQVTRDYELISWLIKTLLNS